ncbi:NorB protein [[Mannheimia] succiniciproducens MBEL55E]|uniref:NorB protein n=1 Tax=Mannheimia succiniciproducens (strain KCTC 0769BP / MBEL55E) TaxID=221988 RepID=Q65VW0_MANSM|nr:NorB protein [[Mannheimia] succiniciproducens MBEL55E]
MGKYKKLWAALVVVLTVTFTILGYIGVEVYRQAPPVPQAYVSQTGETVMTKDDILAGQTAWQTTGGMEVGSLLGHGAYQAPDWTADWLHRELTAWLDIRAQATFNKSYTELDPASQAALQADIARGIPPSKQGE